MAKLTSLEDLGALLPENERKKLENESAEQKKLGYDGKQQKLKVRLDSKKRRGKKVTLVTGFQSSPQELEEMVRTLKKTCGAGGTVLDNALEIQGDHRQKVISFLRSSGFIVAEG